MKNNYKRRQYLVDKDFQIGFILKFTLIVILSSLAIGALVFYLTKSSTTVAIENTKVVVKSTADFILPVLTLTVLVVMFFSSIVLAVLALVVSHRIVGPLYRLRREIELLQEGDFTRQFQVRNRDNLKDLAKSLNTMTKLLREKHDSLKKKSAVLKDFLVQHNYTVSIEDKEKFSALLKDIDDILSSFKV
ncbi:MAG: HAMP domain-containing protein [Candidatus Omnitrophica bacterium]|nr:HAMP domain-containing protein [Candidatus Omnitrophota bacterium]